MAPQTQPCRIPSQGAPNSYVAGVSMVLPRPPPSGASTTRSVRGGTTGWARSSPPSSTRTPGDVNAGSRPRTTGAATGGGSRSVSQSPRSATLSVERNGPGSASRPGSASHSPSTQGLSRGQSGGLRPVSQITTGSSMPAGPQRSASGATLCRSTRKASSKAPTRAKSPSLHTRDRHRKKCAQYYTQRGMTPEGGLTPEGSLSPRSVSGLSCQNLRQERSPTAPQNSRDLVRLEPPALLMGGAAPIHNTGPSCTGSVSSTPRPQSSITSSSPNRVQPEAPEVLHQQPAMSSAAARQHQMINSPPIQRRFFSHQPPPTAPQNGLQCPAWLSPGPLQAPPSPGPGSDPPPQGRSSPLLATEQQNTPTRPGVLTECVTNSPRRPRSSDHKPSRTRSPRAPNSDHRGSPSPSEDNSVSFHLSPIRKFNVNMERAPSAPSLGSIDISECMMGVGPAASLTLSSVSSHRESLTQPPDILQGSSDLDRDLQGKDALTAQSSKETVWPPSSNVTEERSVEEAPAAPEGAEPATKPASPAASTTSSGNKTTSSTFSEMKKFWEDQSGRNQGTENRAVSQPPSRPTSRSGSHSGSGCNSRSNSQGNIQMPPSRESSQPPVKRKRDLTPHLQRLMLNMQRENQIASTIYAEVKPWLTELGESSPDSVRKSVSDSDGSPNNSQASSGVEEESVERQLLSLQKEQSKLNRTFLHAFNCVVAKLNMHSGNCTATEAGAETEGCKLSHLGLSPRGVDQITSPLQPEPLAEPGSSSDGHAAERPQLKVDIDEALDGMHSMASPTRRRMGAVTHSVFQEAADPSGAQEGTLQNEPQPSMPLSPVPQTQSSGEASPASTPSPDGITPLSALNEARLLSEMGSPASGEFANNTSQPGHPVHQETSRTISGGSHLSSPQLEFPSRMMETIGQLDGASPSGASTTAGSMSNEVAGADVTDYSVGGASNPCSPQVPQRRTHAEACSPEAEARLPTQTQNFGLTENAVQPPASSSCPSSSAAASEPQEEPTTPQKGSPQRNEGQSNSPEPKGPQQLDVERLRSELQAHPALSREICDLGGMEQPSLKLLFLRACIMEPGPERRMELWSQVSKKDRRRLLEAMQLTGTQLEHCLTSILSAPDSDASSTPSSDVPQSPTRPERRETSVSPSGSTGSAEGSHQAAEAQSPGSAARVGQSPVRPCPPFGWSIPRNESFLHQIEHSELVQHVRVRMPPTISKGQRLQFVHAGKRHEVEVPEGASPGQEILYEVRKWPPIDRSAGFTQRRGWAFTPTVDRQTLANHLRQTPSMGLTGLTNWQELTDNLVARNPEPTNAPAPQTSMLAHPFFQQRREYYRHLRGKAMDPLLAFTAEEDPSEIEDMQEEPGLSSSSDVPHLQNISDS
eukprot:gnl/MRDRNA2_/MRDRNA2_122394_c0_seq1.p1 gnl/MRDRNA2_/MRDRNA2_122394_c0~~gnl/MRDRNA2_/MRDRNA2_122394_c0_seq1.p1  ORF type:complete len:1419 (-),score=236.17 gnl/MRDRNA2_/MRDRNA2_122394_c0_seq1:47-4174(-)